MERAAVALRILLAVAYPFLAHAANARDDGMLAALALGDIAVIVLLGPLLRRSVSAWALLLVIGACLAWLAGTRHALLPLLAPPVLFVGWAAWLFARSLRAGRVPLLTRLVAPLHGRTVTTLDPALRTYTRGLTIAWAALLGTLCAVNLVLALCAVPDGLLARLGWPSPLAVADVRGSLFANLLVYGVIGGFFMLEYLWRKRRFPRRPYRDFPDFLRQLVALGPRFWRELLH
jgi:hypothetical protein